MSNLESLSSSSSSSSPFLWHYILPLLMLDRVEKSSPFCARHKKNCKAIRRIYRRRLYRAQSTLFRLKSSETRVCAKKKKITSSKVLRRERRQWRKKNRESLLSLLCLLRRSSSSHLSESSLSFIDIERVQLFTTLQTKRVHFSSLHLRESRIVIGNSSRTLFGGVVSVRTYRSPHHWQLSSP